MHDDISLRALYSAVDLMVVPSRLEAFGQTALEAQACGTPVVAFNIGGLKDIILHCETGYLAKAFDEKDLARGIVWTVEQCKNNIINTQSRNQVVKRFNYELISQKYKKIYEKLILK